MNRIIYLVKHKASFFFFLINLHDTYVLYRRVFRFSFTIIQLLISLANSGKSWKNKDRFSRNLNLNWSNYSGEGNYGTNFVVKGTTRCCFHRPFDYIFLCEIPIVVNVMTDTGQNERLNLNTEQRCNWSSCTNLAECELNSWPDSSLRAWTKLGDCGFKFHSGQLSIATSKKAFSGEYYSNSFC